MAFVIGVWVCVELAVSGGPDLEIPYVTVGDGGNAPLTSENSPAADIPRIGWGWGSVADEFQMMRRPLSVAEWQAFVDVLRPYWPYEPGSPLDAVHGFGDWEADGRGGWPALVRVDAAAALANWLHNGQVDEPWAFFTGVYNFDNIERTDTGAIADMSFERPADARYWIPGLDEGVKAGFYAPRSVERPSGRWFRYANASDSPFVPGEPGTGEVQDLINQPPFFLIELGRYPDVESPWGLNDWALAGCAWSETEQADGSVYRFGSSTIDVALTIDDVAEYTMRLCSPTSSRVSNAVRLARSVEAAIDLASPLGDLDSADVNAFIDAFLGSRTAADLAPPFGLLDLSDVDAFIELFLTLP
ncbi:MAG: hypothetical protein AAGI53_10920 [Planctomycetota bacterium]